MKTLQCQSTLILMIWRHVFMIIVRLQKVAVSFVTLNSKTFCMIILNMSNTLKIPPMSLLSCKNCFMLDLIQLNAFLFILLTANSVFRSFFIVLKTKYNFSWSNQFSSSVRCSLKIFGLIILMLLSSSDIIAPLLSLFFISTSDGWSLITVFPLLFSLVLEVEILTSEVYIL